MAIATGKISVAFLILRILGVVSIWKRRFLHFIIYSVFLCATADIIVTFTQCIPIRALWIPSVASHAKCFSPTILTIFALIVSSKFIQIPGMNAANNHRLFYRGRSTPSASTSSHHQGPPNGKEKKDGIEHRSGLGGIVRLPTNLFEGTSLSHESQCRCLCCHQNNKAC